MQNIIEELLVPETNKGLFYGGAFHAASQPGEIVVMNPAKGIRFTTVPDASLQDVAAAVAAARTAFPGWSGLDAFDRSKHLRAFAEVVQDNIPLLAILESTVTGRSPPVLSTLKKSSFVTPSRNASGWIATRNTRRRAVPSPWRCFQAQGL